MAPEIHTIGVSNSGGDCAGLNAVICGVVRAARAVGISFGDCP
jgi:6-phosphofructokinase